MSEANKLLNSLSDAEYASYSAVSPINDILMIDAEGRITNIPSTEILLGVETDHDVERKYFKCPRIVGDNIDLTKLSLRVNFQNANGDRDKYIVEDVTIDGKHITFSWLLSDKVLATKGEVLFTIQAVSVEADGSVKNKWNTTLAKGTVLETLIVDDLYDDESEQARDVLTQLLRMIDDKTDESIQNIQTEGSTQIGKVQTEAATQIKAVEDKGSEVLASIPEEYTDLNNTVEQNINDIYDLQRTKASTIVGNVTGETVYVEDAAAQPPVGLSIFGKSEQSEYTKGYQLFDASRLTTKTGGGVTIKNNGDGSFTISGSGTLSEGVWTHYTLTDEEYSKIMQVGNILYVNAMPITNPFVFFGLYDSDNANIASLSNRQGVSEKLTITQDLVDQSVMARFYILANANSTVQAGTIKPMYYMEGDGTWERFSGGKPGPNPEYPFELENVENPKLVKLGKNLLRDSKIPAKVTMRGITCEYEGDGVFHIYGTFDTTAVDGGLQLATTYLEIPTTPDDVYTLSAQLLEGSIPFRIHPYLGIGNDTVDCKNWFSLWMEPGMKVGAVMSSTYSAGVPLTDATRIPRFWIYGYNESMEALSGDFRIKVWFEKGHNNTGHETCEENIVDLPYELRGIKLTGTVHDSYANYMDSNGTKWIGDEIDLTNGIIYQWIDPITSIDLSTANVSAPANGYTEGNLYLKKKLLVNHAISDSFQYIQSGIASVRFAVLTGGGIYITLEGEYTSDEWKAKIEELSPTFYVALAKPIEIQLTDEEIAAYRKVLMSYPITTLYNSANATMNLKYGIDTKKYVETHGGGNTTVSTGEITLLANGWTKASDNSYYVQTVELADVTKNTKVDLQPTPQQLISFINDSISMFAANESGVINVYAIGGKPASDMTLQVTKTEVVYL